MLPPFSLVVAFKAELSIGMSYADLTDAVQNENVGRVCLPGDDGPCREDAQFTRAV